jgi:hypothetical protein
MFRGTAAVVLALTLSPVLARAQESVFTVNVPSAEVYQSASNVTPVVGHASKGTELPVLRNLGSWVKVTWPDGPDGVGYVHVTMGHFGRADAEPAPAPVSRRASAAPAPAPQAGAIPPRAATPPAPAAPAPTNERVVPRGQQNLRPISHIFGVGGLASSTSNFGATARAWRKNHLGIQLALARDAMTSDVAAGRVTSVQVEPAVMYALFDRVSDYIWIRPYVGSSLSFSHQTLTIPAPIALEPASDNGVGVRFFGGAELTYAAMTQFGLSVDVGYRRSPTLFPGFEPRPLSVSIAGHWYIR